MLVVEELGIDVVAESDRKGKPSGLFWPWFAVGISVLAMSYGAWVLDFGISFWQATSTTIIGVVVLFLLVGVIPIAGKRGNAPTMVITIVTGIVTIGFFILEWNAIDFSAIVGWKVNR